MKHICLALFICTSLSLSAQDADYTKGFFIVNEDWYGHQNSTINYLDPEAEDGDCWSYRVFQAENEGYQLGCTNQFGAIWNGRIYLIAKQAKDPGASVTGGRLTVADAKTMKMLYQTETLDATGQPCDGRGFVGVDEHKGYISTSNGIRVLNLDTYEISEPIEGTINPNPSNLYRAQCGNMLRTDKYIFAAQQQDGLLVIDPQTDALVKTISMDIVAENAGIGSLVKAKDGSIWVSIAKNTSGNAASLPILLRVDSQTLETEVVNIAEDCYGPSNSWYAWTPDTFCASYVENALYWTGGSNTWFTNQNVYRFDVETRQTERIIDLSEDGENWQIYGCSMRPHPQTGDIYMSLYHGFSDRGYITRRYSSQGEKIRDYAMIEEYWFPSIPVFPQSPDNGVSAISDVLASTPTLPESIFTLDGRQVLTAIDDLTPGIYIIRSGNTTRKIMVK